MRKIYNIYVLLVAVVAMAFTSCHGDDNNLDTSNRRGATTFTANFDASRSYFGDKVDGAYPSYWSGDERVMLEIIDSDFLSIRPSESIAMDVVDEAGKYASFTATIEQEFNGGSVYAYVPAASWEYGTDSWGISSYSYKLPTTQTPTATSVDPAAHILRAEYIFEGALPTDVDLTFEHVAAYGKLSIPALEGEDVQSVQIDLTGVWGTEYSYTLNVSELDEPTYWFACDSDLIMAIGITAVTADKSYTYERTFESGSEVLFSTGHVRPLTIAGELIDPSQPEPTSPNCEIHYTATAKVEAHSDYPWTFDTFGANVVSNEWNSESGEGVITFDADVTTIGDDAFFGCNNLTNVTIPDSVTTIGNEVFYDCDNLTSITIPDSVKTIGSSAFRNCDSLTSVTIGDSVTTIGDSAFSNCDSLTSVTIGDSVTTIRDYAFVGCSNLTNVYCKATTPPTLGGWYVFDNNASGRKIYVPAESVEAYKSAAGWSEYADAIIAYDFENGVVVEPEVSINNVIHYTATAKVEANSDYPWSFDTFGANIVSNEWNSESGEGVVTFDADVTTIGYGAFYNCDSLTNVTIPDSVTTIGEWAFYDCDSLTSVTIPDSVTTIGEWAFYWCDSLTSVYCEATTPPSLGGSSVFDYNAPGRKIYVPAASIEAYKTAEYWSKYADYIVGYDFSITSIINYTTYDGQIVNTRLPIISNTYSNGIGTIEFMGSIMPDYAFYKCNSLTSVTIGDSVTTIGVAAFAGCDSLTSVTIPDSVTTIGVAAFEDCTNLTAFNGKFASEDGRCLIIDGTLNSFAPAGLTAYTIPDSVTTIGKAAFEDCDSLTSIMIPDSVTTIGVWAFGYCDSLTSVTIGNSVTMIGDYAFYSCSSLTSVYCEATTPPSLGGARVFDNNASGRTIYVPAASVEAYKTAEYWSEYADYIVGYDFSITSIINYTTYDGQIVNTRLPIISNTYSNGIGTIEFMGSIMPDSAFLGCYSLTSVTIGNSVTTIGDAAFYYCPSLTSIIIPDSVTTIGQEAFRECYSLTSVTIGNSVTTIGDAAFYDCYSFTSVTIGNSVTTIGQNAFAFCKSLTSITIPDSVTTIGNWAFSGCDSLTSVTIGNSVTTIGERAFGACNSLVEFNGKFASEDGRCLIVDGTLNSFAPAGLTAYTIIDSVTTIGSSAFYNCDSLTSVTIPDSVTTIGESSFYDCSSLTSVYCEATTPPSLSGSEVFDYNAYGRKIYVPAASVEAYKTADYWSEYASYIVGYDFENGENDGDPNTITLNTFVYNADLRGSYLGYSFKATSENVELGICIGSKSCSKTSIDAGDYTYYLYPEDLAYAFQLRGSNINGTDVSNDPNATMNVAVNGGVYTITIVTNGYTLTYNGTL